MNDLVYPLHYLLPYRLTSSEDYIGFFTYYNAISRPVFIVADNINWSQDPLTYSKAQNLIDALDLSVIWKTSWMPDEVSELTLWDDSISFLQKVNTPCQITIEPTKRLVSNQATVTKVGISVSAGNEGEQSLESVWKIKSIFCS